MKINTSIFFILLILAFSSSVSTTCADHKGWVKLKVFLQTLVNGNPDVEKALGKLVSNFESSTPSTPSEADLGVCSAYANQKSCCTKKMADFFDKAVLLKTKPLLAKDNIVNKLLKFVVRLLGNVSCVAKSGITKPTSTQDVRAVSSSIAALQTLIDGNRKCKLDFAKSISSMSRGAACFACSDPDKLSDYIDASGKFILSQSSVTEFQTASAAALDCFTTLLSDANLGTVATEIATYYLAASDACIASISTKVTNVFKGKIKSKDSGNQPNCKGLSLFNSDDTCEKSMESDVDPATAPVSRFLKANSSYRILADDSVQASTASGGIKSFVSSPTDDQISEDGNISIAADYTFGMKFSFSFFFLALIYLLTQ